MSLGLTVLGVVIGRDPIQSDPPVTNLVLVSTAATYIVFSPGDIGSGNNRLKIS